jgi:hypothetical protein
MPDISKVEDEDDPHGAKRQPHPELGARAGALVEAYATHQEEGREEQGGGNEDLVSDDEAHDATVAKKSSSAAEARLEPENPEREGKRKRWSR